jgi:hypothetical protein
MGYKAEILPDPLPFKRSSIGITKAPTQIQAVDIVIDDGYHHHAQIEFILNQFQEKYPNIALMLDIGKSHYGRTIWAMKISDNVAVDEDEPAILFNGLHHARELISTEAVLDTAYYLTANYGVDPDVTGWVDEWEIWLIPVVNPDGNDIVFNQDVNWRKNARDNNLNGRIDGADGVDLNRNYPFKWGLVPGSSGVQESSTYRGPAPASEPETQAVMELALRERFVFSIAYHSAGGVILFPYGSQTAINPIPNISESICSQMADICVREDNRKYDFRPRLYDVNGLDRDWHYYNGTIGFVVELSLNGFQPDYDTWRDDIVEGVRPGWQYLLDRINGPSLYGHVIDGQTSAPVEANIEIEEIRFFEGETRTSDPYTGSYRWILNPGTYNVSFSASGYTSQSFRLNIDKAHNLDVKLQPEPASISENEETDDDLQTDVTPSFALLQNYPNPFNPATWIPFRISEPSDVTVSIYSLNGDLIRQFHLGQIKAGEYISKNEAVFWDGRDDLGEYVSGGVYFYSIRAGEASGIRKLIILGR